MSDRILEQRIKIKFCVKLENNDPCVLIPTACGGESMEKSRGFVWYK
jgi:hypothetical protein